MFNKTMNLLVDSGFVKGWFSWIEWITLTAVLIALGLQFKYESLFFAGIMSICLVYLYAVVSISNATKRVFDKNNTSGLIRVPVAFLLAFVLPGFIMFFVGRAIYALVQAAAT